MMIFEESPSLDLYKKGIPEKLPDPYRKKKILWGVISVLFIVGLALGGIRMKQSGTLDWLAGKGTLTGMVVDDFHRPIPADVYLPELDRSTRCDENGRFTFEGVPAGTHTVLIAYRVAGREYPVQVFSGRSHDVGTLRFLPGDFDHGWSQVVNAVP